MEGWLSKFCLVHSKISFSSCFLPPQSMLELIITHDLWFNFLKTIWPPLPLNIWNPVSFFNFTISVFYPKKSTNFHMLIANRMLNFVAYLMHSEPWIKTKQKKDKLQDIEKIQQSLNLLFRAAGFLLLTWCANFDHLSQKLVSSQYNVCPWNSPFIHPRPTLHLLRCRPFYGSVNFCHFLPC